MKTYIGVKMIQAQPMTKAEHHARKGIPAPSLDSPGYLVVYQPDGYESWSPKAVFEAAYLPLEDPTKITKADVESMVHEAGVADLPGGKSTLVSLEARTGFLLHEVASCVDPANYDRDVGEAIGLQRAKSKLWDSLGFVLQWAKNGLKPAS